MLHIREFVCKVNISECHCWEQALTIFFSRSWQIAEHIYTSPVIIWGSPFHNSTQQFVGLCSMAWIDSSWKRKCKCFPAFAKIYLITLHSHTLKIRLLTSIRSVKSYEAFLLKWESLCGCNKKIKNPKNKNLKSGQIGEWQSHFPLPLAANSYLRRALATDKGSLKSL